MRIPDGMRVRVSDVATWYEATPPHTVEVVDKVAGGEIRAPLVHRVKHSPTGFSWGYGGSGPADLARSLLVDALGYGGLCGECSGSGRERSPEGTGLLEEREDRGPCSHCAGTGISPWVEAAYQTFKVEVVAQFPQDDPWMLARSAVMDWCSDHA